MIEHVIQTSKIDKIDNNIEVVTENESTRVVEVREVVHLTISGLVEHNHNVDDINAAPEQWAQFDLILYS